MNINYILKVEDARPADIQKALKEAGITVRSIQEVHKEGQKKEQEKETTKTDA
ncbi:MAG: hypothetical protein P8Y66_05930 [Nitrospirota bacterium]|jgi:hypothetical protein